MLNVENASALSDPDSGMTTSIEVNQMQLIKVAEGQPLRSGVRTITGSMELRHLIPDGYIVPHRDTRTKDGYQRLPQDSRIRDLARALDKRRVDLPTAILLNLRDVNPSDVLVEDEVGGLQLRIGPDDAEEQDTMPPVPRRFFVVDGQHRILALHRLYVDDPQDEWGHFKIQFVCMLGASKDEEVEQFYVVNSTAKSVRTDLALDLLKQRAEKDSRVMEALYEKGEAWKVRAEGLVEKLSNVSSVWHGRVRYPNSEKGETTISNAGMVSSLKPALSAPYFGSLNTDQQVKILDAFWQGVRLACRPAFDAPGEFALQKGVGVTAMHQLFLIVIEHVRARGRSVFDPDAYFEILEPVIRDLQGDSVEAGIVQGAEFWRSGPAGAAGQYSSSAGRRTLMYRLQGVMPDLEVE